MAVFEFLRGIATPGLDRIMKAITDLGSTAFYILIVPIIYWCMDKSLGFGLAVALSISNYLNLAIKFIVCRARPYVAFPHLDAPEFLKLTGTGYSFPSGHAQVVSTFWVYLARHLKAKWVTVTGTVAVILVAFTRVYATVHYPTDVLVGVALGSAIAYLYLDLEDRVRILGLQGKKRVGLALAVSVIVPGFMLGISALFNRAFSEEVAQVLGFIAGAGVGYILESEYVKYDVRAPGSVQIIKVVLGFIGMMGIRYGLKALFPGNAFWDMLRYALIAIWATLGAPFLFKNFLGPRSRPSKG